jgi:hypothetical protein
MSCACLSNIADALTIAGLVFGILGSLLMANQYLAVAKPGAWLWIVISSLWRSNLARGTARAKEANSENVLRSLQGLAFLALSFICQLVTFVLEHVTSRMCKGSIGAG